MASHDTLLSKIGIKSSTKERQKFAKGGPGKGVPSRKYNKAAATARKQARKAKRETERLESEKRRESDAHSYESLGAPYKPRPSGWTARGKWAYGSPEDEAADRKESDEDIDRRASDRKSPEPVFRTRRPSTPRAPIAPPGGSPLHVPAVGGIPRVAAVGNLAALDDTGAQAPHLPSPDHDDEADFFKKGGSTKRKHPLRKKR